MGEVNIGWRHGKDELEKNERNIHLETVAILLHGH